MTIKNILAEQDTFLRNWNGSVSEAKTLLSSTGKYTGMNAKNITAKHFEDLDAIISNVRRILEDVENAMDNHINTMTAILNVES